jgi:glycine/D-amino acid oxidase-like deaminating enzyme
MTLSPDFKEIPYWLDPPPLVKSFSGAALPARTDVLVVGSGYTGVAAAIRLKQAGLGVTLIDRLKLATAASARNGGMTLTGLSREPVEIENRLGEEKAKQLFTESLESVNSVERLAAESGIDCDFRRCGHLETAFKPAHFEKLKRDQERLNKRYHHKTHIIAPADLKRELDSGLYHGGLLDPASAGLHPAKFIAGLITMADDLGVNLCEEVNAETIVHRGSGFSIRTNRGKIAADEIIVATNGYTGTLTPWLRRRLVSTESLMIATEKLPPDLVRRPPQITASNSARKCGRHASGHAHRFPPPPGSSRHPRLVG